MDVVQQVLTAHQVMRDGWAEYFESAIKNYEYVIGEQISPAVSKQLRDEQRPELIFNMTQPKIVTLAGILEANKVYMRAVPINEGDEQKADLRTMLVSDWAMKNCSAYKEFIHATIDAAIAGIGWLNNYWSTQRHPGGMWVTEAFDPFMIRFDVDGKKMDQTDWKYLGVSGMFGAEEMIGVYLNSLADADVETMKERDSLLQSAYRSGSKKPMGWLDRIVQGFRDAYGEKDGTQRFSSSYENGLMSHFANSATGRYTVIEFHDRRTVNKKQFVDLREEDPFKNAQDVPERGEKEETRDYHNRLVEELRNKNLMDGPVHRIEDVSLDELWITAVCPTLLPEKPLFEAPYEVQGKGFQHKPVFCYPFHPDITKTASIVDILIHPQDSYNQRRMTALEWLMQSVSPDVHAPENSISPLHLNDWKSRKRKKILFYSPRGGLKPESQQPSPQSFEAIRTMQEEDKELMESLTLITPNLLGLSENSGESGVLFAQRVQRSMQALSFLFGNMTLAMKGTFNYCDASLQTFMTLPRKIRLLNKDNQPNWLALNWQTIDGVQNDITQGEFDFEVDTSQLGETSKQIKFREAIEFVSLIAQYVPEGIKWDELFKLWDSPVAAPMGEYLKQIMAAKLGMAVEQMEAARTQQSLDTAQAGISTTQGMAGLATQLTPGLASPSGSSAGPSADAAVLG